jgi:Amt family ammonium transporter
MAERTKFSAYLIYSFVVSAFIYPVVGHWIWGGGWLAKLGMWDFAGSTVVHSTGGWLALIGAIMLGPRIGKYSREGKPQAIPGHSLPMAALGVFILWLGWFGFNPGSTMAADASIAQIATTTNLAAAMGAIGALIASWLSLKKPDVSMTLNGVLAGLVAITAPCAFVSPLSAAIIGLAAGVVVVFSVILLDRAKVDDPVGAVSVHGVCGALGTIALGLFAQEGYAPANTTGNGLLFGGGFQLLLAQTIGVVAVLRVVCGDRADSVRVAQGDGGHSRLARRGGRGTGRWRARN